jgi:GntR family transcriptional regulator
VTEFEPILRNANARMSRQLRIDGQSIWSADIGDRHLEVLDLTVDRADDAPEHVAELLGTHSVVVRDRVYAVDGRRVQWARSYLPAELVAGTRIELEDTEPGGTFARLAEIGFEPAPPFVEDVEFIDAVFVSEEERAKLAIGRADSVVQIRRRNATAKGRLVEVTDMRLVASAYRFRWAFGA